MYILIYTNNVGRDMMNLETNDDQEGIVMVAKVQKWGNSLGVRIPQRLTKKYNLVNGSQVRIMDDGQGILLKPENNEYTLEELLAQCEGENPHSEFFSEPMGKEEI